MSGTGNKFHIYDARKTPQNVVIKGADCDQIIVMENSTNADVFMRIYNNDGSEVNACGNATRCVAYLIGQGASVIETKAGMLRAFATGKMVKVDMGKPVFAWQDIPLSEEFPDLEGGFAVSMGNPHIVFFTSDIDNFDLKTLGKKWRTRPL